MFSDSHLMIALAIVELTIFFVRVNFITDNEILKADTVARS